MISKSSLNSHVYWNTLYNIYSGTQKTVKSEDDRDTQCIISKSPMNTKHSICVSVHRAIYLYQAYGKLFALKQYQIQGVPRNMTVDEQF